MSNLSSRGAEWEAKRKYILERDDNLCGYCGNEANSVDHIIPKASGGTDDESNLIACCRNCNSTKGAKTLVRTNYVNKKWLERI